MNASKVSPGERPLLYAVLAFFAVAIPYAALNQYAGTSHEAMGLIESAGVLPTDSGPMREVAKVRLADGTRVEALVVSGGPVRVGDFAHMRVYSRFLSKRPAYEVYRTQAPP